MAASTGPREASRKEGQIVAQPVLAATKINKGTLASIDTTGYLRPARSGTTSDVFAGVSYETADNTGGASGGAVCRINKTGTYVFAKGSATAQADLGQPFYAADDQTVTATATNNQLVGTCVEVLDSTNLRIRIDGAAK